MKAGLEERQKVLIDTFTNAKLDLFPAADDPLFLKCTDELAKIETKLLAISFSNESISELKKAIETQKKLSENIERFITSGSEIASQRRESTCLLCTHDHGTFEELLKHI